MRIDATSRETFTEAVQPKVRPYRPFADSGAVQGSRRLSKGAVRLWELVHSLGRQTALERRYSPATTQVVFALPQSLLATALDYTDRHLRNLQRELEEAELLDSHPLAARVQGRNLWSTTLWAVKLTTRNTTPRLRVEDFTAEWRDFETDLQKKNTAQSIISGLKTLEEAKRVFVLFRVAVSRVFEIPTRYSSSRPEIHLGDVQEAIYRLGDLAEGATPGAVGNLAGVLASGLNDSHSLRWWAKQLWQVCGSWEKIGALQAKLHRLLVDLREHPGLKNPGGWANARLAAGVN